jgi:hypothetical protein
MALWPVATSKYPLRTQAKRITHPWNKVIHDVKALPRYQTPYGSISQKSDIALNADLGMSRTTIRFIKCQLHTTESAHGSTV